MDSIRSSRNGISSDVGASSTRSIQLKEQVASADEYAPKVYCFPHSLCQLLFSIQISYLCLVHRSFWLKIGQESIHHLKAKGTVDRRRAQKVP